MSRRLIVLLALVALLTPLALAGQPVSADESVPYRALQGMPVDETGTYIVQLDNPSLARYRGGLRDLAPTSIEVTGERKLEVSRPAAQAYLAFLAERRAEILQRAEERLGRRLDIGYVYDVILNGFSVKLTPAEAALVASLPGVRHVEPEQVRQLLTDRGPQWIGAPAAWGAAPDCSGGNCGEGVVIGVVDTGLNFDHPSFADIGGDGYNHTNPLGAGVYKGWCNSGFAVKVTCNDKVIGAWSYSNSGNNPEDPEGHGSHTASTAGGNRLNNILLDEPTIDLTFNISGVAPHANIIAYDACTPSGCNTTDLVAALNQAATDGVDALNYSISGSGESPWVALDEQAFLDLRLAGAFVSASAGNSGPGAATVAHGSPWVTTTAASTHDRALVNAVINLTTNQGTMLPDIYGRSVTAPLPAAPIVYAGNYGGNNLCLPGVWGGGTFANQIVICDRGNNARVDKAINVRDAGGAGMILVNAASNGDEVIGDAYAIPGVHITYNAGVMLKAWLNNGNTGHVGAILGTTQNIAANNGDVMAAFSSRGPNNQAPDILKPDMTAPGVDILAAWATIAGEPVPELEIISGTSMSSPHMAGAGALMMKAKYPAWTVAEIQSAMMTTALFDNTVREEDGATPTDPFDRGSGRVNVAAALNAGLLLNITGAQYDAADPATGGDPKTLNYPSMADDACYKSCGWTRTVRNPTGQSMTWNGVFIGRDGLQGTLTVPSFPISAGGTQTFGVNITDVSGLTPGQWYFGHVVYTEDTGDAPQAHFPVAIQVSGSTDSAMIRKSASTTGVAPGGATTYSVTIDNKVSTARTFSLTDPVPAGASYVNGSATGGWTYNSGPNNLTWSGSMPAATFVVEERTLSGYQSMAAEGIAPFQSPVPSTDIGGLVISGMNFSYVGVNYTQMVWCADGYLIPSNAGSITSCQFGPQSLPSTNSPNNVLAPWWDDLNLSGGNWYAVGLMLNGKPHSVFEWENALVKDTGARISFQLWIEDGTDNIWYAYKPGFNPGANPSASVGAENATGQVGASYYYKPTSGSATGKVPDGTKDLWVGLKPSSKTFTYQALMTAGANNTVVNEASVTVSSTTNTAVAGTRICGPATAVQPNIAIQALHYTLTGWAGSPYDSFQVWRSTSPYDAPGTGGSLQVYGGKSTSFVDAAAPVVGDPGTNHFYTVRTLNCAGTSSADSYSVAEFDYALTPGN